MENVSIANMMENEATYNSVFDSAFEFVKKVGGDGNNYCVVFNYIALLWGGLLLWIELVDYVLKFNL